MKQQLFIDGQWCDGITEYALYSPYSEQKIADIAAASLEQADQALQSARDALGKMRRLSAYERSSILLEASRLLQVQKQVAARLIALEAAKPIKAALVEVERTITTLQLAAEEAKRIYGETLPTDSVPGGENRIAFTKKEPVGVVAAITPFNFPMNLVAHKLGPAIAAGNTVVLKPAEQTPCSAAFIVRLFEQAGLPSGALQLLTGVGKQLGEYIVQDERVNYVSFTGSVAVGKQVKQAAGLKGVTLELGANSAVIIDQACQIDQVAKRCVVGAFSNQGQVCISLQRIYVHEVIFTTFIERLKYFASQLMTGDPLDPNTDVSALINKQALHRAKATIDEALALGARLEYGGSVVNNVMEPTIISSVVEATKLMQEEIFAPVVAVNSISSIEEGIELVNASRFGLQAGIYTNNLELALQAAEELQVAGVLINDIPTFRLDHLPYGGWKDSGIGREGIKYAIEELTETKLIIINRNKS